MLEIPEVFTLEIEGGWTVRIMKGQLGRKIRVEVIDHDGKVKEIVETDQNFVHLESL